MKYKIMYYVGDEITLKTKVNNGYIFIKDNKPYIFSKVDDIIILDRIINIDLLRLNGLGRILKIELLNKTIFVSVVRICIGGIFAIVNYIKTGELYKELQNYLLK